LIDPTGDILVAGRCHETLANLLAAPGETGAAQHELAVAHELFARKGYVPGESRTREQLARLAKAAK